MFSEDFRQKLQIGKYTRWAAELTDDQLEAALWAIGEYGSIRGCVSLVHSPARPGQSLLKLVGQRKHSLHSLHDFLLLEAEWHPTSLSVGEAFEPCEALASGDHPIASLRPFARSFVLSGPEGC